ncbi:MAG: VWA domain-containing protein [Campylobacterota bacterium]|nr:VWA domain-containing protein [Campylobacterota bacterium]
MFNQFTFEYPYVLALILPFIICAKYCKAKSPSYYMPHLHIYAQTQPLNNHISNIAKWLIIICALVALASPVKHLQTIHKKSDGIDIVLALDTSGSMRHIGFDRSNVEKNRWQVVKEIVQDFIPKRVNDNIAIMVFGTAVMTASPLSYDKKAQATILSHLDIGVAGDKTALLDSIASSVNILKDSKAKSRIIILLTDGEDTASKIPYQVVIKLALKHNIKIYTIGIGQINQNLLHKISEQTKGSFFLANSKEDLKDIYNQIDALETSRLDQNKIVLKEYYFFYPLFLAVMFLILFIYLKNKRGEI